MSRSPVAAPHTCGYRTALPGDEDEATGPACGKPAEWRHCVLLVPVCTEHRCRCRTPIEPSRSPVGGPALGASFGGYVRYPDPTTGESLYRVRTPEDGALPGDRRTFEGALLQWRDSRTDTDHMMIRGENGCCGVDLDDVVKGLDGKRIRVTIEVLPEPPTDGRTSSGEEREP